MKGGHRHYANGRGEPQGICVPAKFETFVTFDRLFIEPVFENERGAAMQSKWLVGGVLMALWSMSACAVHAQEAKLELKIVDVAEKYVLDRGGKSKEEYEKYLQGGGKGLFKAPPAPKVDLKLQIINTGKDAVGVFLGGDPNVVTLELKGPGVVEVRPLIAMTREFRLPKLVSIEAGKAYEIPLPKLSDGVRGVSRNVYWTEEGEYTLSATYKLSADNGGEAGPLLRSAPVKIKVELKK
jgi:hypothetical protein